VRGIVGHKSPGSGGKVDFQKKKKNLHEKILGRRTKVSSEKSQKRGEARDEREKPSGFVVWWGTKFGGGQGLGRVNTGRVTKEIRA